MEKCVHRADCVDGILLRIYAKYKDVWFKNMPKVLAQNKIQFIIDKVNNELSIIEKIKKFIIIDDPFTIENEMLTPTMKTRRHQVKKVYGDQLEKLYF